MQTIDLKLEIEDSLYEDIKKQGIDLKAQIQEFVAGLKDDGYPAISKEEAKQRVGEAIKDYRKNGMKNCQDLDDDFWNNTEERLFKRHNKVS